MPIHRNGPLGILLLAFAIGTLGLASTLGCSGGCDAQRVCLAKTDKIITGSKIIPVCDAPTQKDGTRYSWQTDDGKCTCTLDQSIAGNFWRGCKFE